MSTRYDDDIREAELRLVRDRQALVAQAEDLSASARAAASSPKGLIAAFAIGFVLGELTAPRRSRRSRTGASQAAHTADVTRADTTTKMGLGGLIGSMLFAYARSRYASPWALGRSAWNFYAATRQARNAAAPRRTGTAPPSAPADASSVPAAAAAATAPRVAPGTAYAKPLHSPRSHAAG